MTLNCKQGDLAIIVKSTCGNEGKIVRCLELLHTAHVPDTNGRLHKHADGVHPMWRIDRPITFANIFDSTQIMYCSDSVLRPLRGDLDDETIEEGNELSTHV